MEKFRILVLVLTVVAACILAAGCIGTDTPATPTATPTGTATVVPTGTSADNAPVATITVEKHGTAIPAGNMIRFVVPGNPTTGYSWMAENVSGLVINQTYAATPVADGIAGSEGNDIFTITAEKAGTYQFIANYQRSWENEIPAATLNETLVFSGDPALDTADPLLTVTFTGSVSPTPSETVKIIAAGNPTTGYEWIAQNTTGLLIQNATYVPTPVADGVVGSGGTYEWLVTAEKAGTYESHAQYKRSWEEEIADEFFFNITFR